MDEVINLIQLLQDEIHTIHILVGITFVVIIGFVSGILTHVICKMIIENRKDKYDRQVKSKK